MTTEDDAFVSLSQNAILEVKPYSSPTFEIENDGSLWELTCTYKQPKNSNKLVGCQQTIADAGIQAVCMNRCNTTDGHVYATKIVQDTNHHIFKPSSSLCKSAAFAGIAPGTPLRIVPSNAYSNYVPIIHNGIESELSLWEKGFTLVTDFTPDKICYDYIAVERNVAEMEVWASSVRTSEIYENERIMEARHAFTNNSYEPIPWAAADSDPDRSLIIDFSKEYRINRLHFMNVIQMENSPQNYYCNKTEIYVSDAIMPLIKVIKSLSFQTTIVTIQLRLHYIKLWIR